MLFSLEQGSHYALLKPVGGKFSPQDLEKLICQGEPNNPGSPSFDAKFIARGGEAELRLFGDTVLRFERKLLDPRTSNEDRERYLKKLKLLAGALPATAVPPKQPIILVGSNVVVGHTMEYLDDLQLLKDAASSFTGEAATEVLISLHRFIGECHASGIILGEINLANFGVRKGKFVGFDTACYGVSDFPCKTIYQPTLDPKIICQDESIGDHTAEAWKLGQYSVLSDWYAFSCIVLEVFLGVGPWGAPHRLQLECNELRRMRVRALRGLSIFDPNVELGSEDLYREPEAIGEALYEHLFNTFNRGQRLNFPFSLLAELKWEKCGKCGREVAASICPCGQVLRELT